MARRWASRRPAGPTTARGNGGIAVNESRSEITSDLIDLTAVDLGQIQAMISELPDDDSALAHSLRRIMHEAETPARAIAGFSSSM